MKDDLKDSIERAGKTLYLKRRWDDQLAEYVYELREVSRMNQFSEYAYELREVSRMNQFSEYVYELREVSRMNQFSDVLIADGDREWAGRQSDHYKLKIRGES